MIGRVEPLQSSDHTAAAPGRRGAKAYFVAIGVSQVFALLRYTLLARILGPEQLGLAATLIVTGQFFDSITDTGGDRFLIQDAEGDLPAVQKLLQAVFLARGALTAAALVAFAVPIAAFYKTPALAGGLMVLAVAPLINGLLHSDMRRVQRRHDFRAESLGLIASESLSMVVTVLVAWFTHSFTAVAFGLIARSVALVVVSHLRSERPYRLSFAREHMARLARFAWPLMINGWLLFMGSQTDRILVANQLGLVELGRYSAVLLLAFYPVGMLYRYVAATYLPRVAAGLEPARRERAAHRMGGQALLLALAMTAGFATVGPPMVGILYGSRFTQAGVLVCLIGITQTTRFMRIWPTTVALGLGRSDIVLANNVARLVGLPAAIAGVLLMHGLIGVVGGFILGEVFALMVALLLLNRAGGKTLTRDTDRVALFILSSATIVAWSVVLTHPSLPAAAALACVTAALAVWLVRREAATIAEALETARTFLGRSRRAA